MPSKMTNTPTPWTVLFDVKKGGWVISADNNMLTDIAFVPTQITSTSKGEKRSKCNAEFICIAVNSHEALVDLLWKAKGLILALVLSEKDFKLTDPWMKKFVQVFSNASGEKVGGDGK